MSALQEHEAVIHQAADTFGISLNILRAQVKQESGGHADAFRFEPSFYSRYIVDNPAAKARQYGPLAACSYGLLQVMLETAVELGFMGRPWDLFDPSIGLTWGVRYYVSVLQWSQGNAFRALCAYNGGKAGNTIPPYRNASYATAVFRAAGMPVPGAMNA